MTVLIAICRGCLIFTVVVLTAYAVRHHLLVLFRLCQRKSRDTMELVGYAAPTVSVLVPMHNEEKVAADVLQALVDCD